MGLGNYTFQVEVWLRRHLESVPGYHALCKVSQVVEDMLCELTIEDIEEKASSPAGLSPDASLVRASQLDDQTTTRD